MSRHTQLRTLLFLNIFAGVLGIGVQGLLVFTPTSNLFQLIAGQILVIEMIVRLWSGSWMSAYRKELQ